MTRTELYSRLIEAEGKNAQAEKVRIACQKVMDDMVVAGSVDGSAASTEYTIATLEEAIRCYKMAFHIEAECDYQRRLIRNGYQLAIGLRKMELKRKAIQHPRNDK